MFFRGFWLEMWLGFAWFSPSFWCFFSGVFEVFQGFPRVSKGFPRVSKGFSGAKTPGFSDEMLQTAGDEKVGNSEEVIEKWGMYKELPGFGKTPMARSGFLSGFFFPILR